MLLAVSPYLTTRCIPPLQVRETKKVDAPTTPSSGTAWSESAAGSPKAI